MNSVVADWESPTGADAQPKAVTRKKATAKTNTNGGVQCRYRIFSRIKAGNVSSSSWVCAIGLDGLAHAAFTVSTSCTGKATAALASQASLPRGRTAPPPPVFRWPLPQLPRLGYRLRFQLPLPLSLRPHRLLHLTRWQTSKKLFSAHDGERECQSTSTRSRLRFGYRGKETDTTKDNVSPFAFSQRLTACSKALRVNCRSGTLPVLLSQAVAAGVIPQLISIRSPTRWGQRVGLRLFNAFSEAGSLRCGPHLASWNETAETLLLQWRTNRDGATTVLLS